jgi:hypothetical protein
MGRPTRAVPTIKPAAVLSVSGARSDREELVRYHGVYSSAARENDGATRTTSTSAGVLELLSRPLPR